MGVFRIAAALMVLLGFLTTSALAADGGGIMDAPPETPTPKSDARKLPNELPKKPVAKAVPIAPEDQVKAFFDALQKDKVEQAYEGLISGTLIADRAEEATRLQERTQTALDAYGPVRGSELIKDEKVGTHLRRMTYLLLGEALPLRWKFYFYNGSGQWRLVDLRVDDDLVDTFEE